jgi:hypothetical protein
LLGWSKSGDVDLVVGVPNAAGDGGASECLYGTGAAATASGDLSSDPFAQLDHDSTGKQTGGTETVRIAMNEDGSGPYYNGTYSVVVNVLDVDKDLTKLLPTVRLVRQGENGAATVTLYTLPEDAVATATGWHVFDLHGDGTLTNGGETENRDDVGDPTGLACVAESIAGNP